MYPGLSYDSNEGVVVSVNAGIYYQSDTLARPFSSGIDPLRFIYSTEGQRDLQLFWDNPDLLLTGIRWNLFIQFYRHTQYDFTGRDEFLVETAALVEKDNPEYFTYEKDRMRFIAQFLLPIHRQHLKLLVGTSLNHHKNSAGVDSYLYELYSEERLSEKEYFGGEFYTLRAGLIYDSRDNEKNPTSGWWNEGILSPTIPGTGDFQFTKLLLMSNYYKSVSHNMVLTPRLTFQKSWGDEPFFSMVEYVNSLERYEGLGGNYSLRGIARNRLVGNEQFTLNMEIRYMAFHRNLLSSRFDGQLMFFYDLGGMNISGYSRWLSGYGTGLRLYWNDNFLITFTAGFSKGSELQFY